MIWFEVYEGTDSEDRNYIATPFRSEAKARKHLAESKAAWVRIDKWDGHRLSDGTYDGDYTDTIAERK